MENENQLQQDLKDLFTKHEIAMLDVAHTYADLFNFLANNKLIDLELWNKKN